MSERFYKIQDIERDKIMDAAQRWPAFKAEHPEAVNTTIGVIIDPNNDQPWQPQSVSAARIIAIGEAVLEGNFGYQAQAGNKAFLSAAKDMVFGEGISSSEDNRLLAYQTVGGTGTLNLSKEILENIVRPNKSGVVDLVYDAGWPNHPVIFHTKFQPQTYNHFDSQTGQYDHDAAVKAFDSAPANSVFLLQTCGYNDDGMDRTKQQWQDILDIAEHRKATLIFDSAYMGLVDGAEQERQPILDSIDRGLLTFVTFSTSKNMGLYNDRLGALFIANTELNLGEREVDKLDKLASRIIRRTISNPPYLAAKAAAMALGQESYKKELDYMRSLLAQKRSAFAEVVGHRLPSVENGKGLFLKVFKDGFSPKQMKVLYDSNVYALESSRVNLGGIHLDDIQMVAEGIIKAISL